MRTFRTILFWCHLATGITVGTIVLLMSVTGVLLTYERQLVDWADMRSLAAAPSTSGPRLSMDVLTSRATAAHAGTAPSRVTESADPSRPVAFVFGRDETLFIDAHTGAVLGHGVEGIRHFFQRVTAWHRWLGTEASGRGAARSITGACNLGFFFLVCSGLYLWWPRGWTWRHFRQGLWFRRGLAGKARDFNWHHVFGFWCFVPLLVIVGSGVVMSYPWANALLYRAAGEAVPARGRPRAAAGPRGGDRHATRAAATISLDRAWKMAEQQTPGWRTLTLQLPVPANGAATFSVDSGTGGQPQKRGQLTIDAATGAVASWEPFADQSRGRRWRSWARFLHTGEAFGIVGQSIAGVASAGAVLLVWTGFALAWRRLLRAVRSSRASAVAVRAKSRKMARPASSASYRSREPTARLETE
jgi:uncharacterized iron-regulated membrane protein